MTKTELLAMLQADRDAIAALRTNAASDQAIITSLTNRVSELEAGQNEAAIDEDIANAVMNIDSDLHPVV